MGRRAHLRLLLDTHALLWFLLGDERLPERARAAILEPSAHVFVSAVSAMEVATKFRLGKLPAADFLVRNWARLMADQLFEELPISTAHALRAGMLAIPHRDPFDRLLIAQSQAEEAALVSNEAAFDQWGVIRLW